MAALNQHALTILRRTQVETRPSLSHSCIYARIRPSRNRSGEYEPTFPKPVSIGTKAVGWIETEIDAWIIAQVEKSRKALKDAR